MDRGKSIPSELPYYAQDWWEYQEFEFSLQYWFVCQNDSKCDKSAPDRLPGWCKNYLWAQVDSGSKRWPVFEDDLPNIDVDQNSDFPDDIILPPPAGRRVPIRGPP
jgi:hypothetical protein